jgi:excisionase family DNA binding protein
MRLPIDTGTVKLAAAGPAEPVLDYGTRAPKLDENGAALLISVEEAASILGIGRTLMFELMMQGKVSSVKIGRRRLVVRQELDEFVRELSISQNSNHFAEHYLT